MAVSHATRASGSLAEPDVNGPAIERGLLWISRAGKVRPPCGPVPKRQVHTSGTTGILAQLEVLNARVTHEPRALLGQQRGGCRSRRVHHRVDVIALHLPGRRRSRDRAEDSDPGPFAEALVVA